MKFLLVHAAQTITNGRCAGPEGICKLLEVHHLQRMCWPIEGGSVAISPCQQQIAVQIAVYGAPPFKAPSPVHMN